MRRFLRVITFAALTCVPGTAWAQTTGNGPYYATPSWDQKLQCDTLATCPRFVVLSNWNNEAVLDRETGLVWERSGGLSAIAPWELAAGLCNSKVVGNRKGWRVPNIQELASLVDPSVHFPGPTLPSGHPFEGVAQDFWSSTPSEANVNLAWYANFHTGDMLQIPKSLTLPTLCVRGGPVDR